MAAQATDEQRRAVADVVLDNGGTPESWRRRWTASGASGSSPSQGDVRRRAGSRPGTRPVGRRGRRVPGARPVPPAPRADRVAAVSCLGSVRLTRTQRRQGRPASRRGALAATADGCRGGGRGPRPLVTVSRCSGAGDATTEPGGVWSSRVAAQPSTVSRRPVWRVRSARRPGRLRPTAPWSVPSGGAGRSAVLIPGLARPAVGGARDVPARGRRGPAARARLGALDVRAGAAGKRHRSLCAAASRWFWHVARWGAR